MIKDVKFTYKQTAKVWNWKLNITINDPFKEETFILKHIQNIPIKF